MNAHRLVLHRGGGNQNQRTLVYDECGRILRGSWLMESWSELPVAVVEAGRITTCKRHQNRYMGRGGFEGYAAKAGR